MSRKFDEVLIREARNGFVVHEPAPQHQVLSTPYVFESFDHLVSWLRDNYVEGEQPGEQP